LFDLRNPAVATWVEKNMPDIYADRIAYAEARAELDRRIFDLRMFGPRNEADVELYYFLVTGQIEPPGAPLWNWEKWNVVKKDGFTNGLFPLRRVIEAKKPDPLHYSTRWDPMDSANQGDWALPQFKAGPSKGGQFSVPQPSPTGFFTPRVR
jgi:hypothetical protein